MELSISSVLTTLLIGIITLVLLYWCGTRNHNYWKKRGIRYVKPFPFLGNLLDFFKEPLHVVEGKRYKEYGMLYGHFEGNRHILSVAHPNLLREILVRDFQFFNRRRDVTTGNRIFDRMLFAQMGEDWKRVRSIITPTFSTGKMKRMLSIFVDCSRTLVQNFRKAAEKGESIDAKRLYGAFTMDVIASSAFSTKIDSHNDPDNEFLKTQRILFSNRFTWRFFVFALAPSILKFFGMSIFPGKAMDFFEDVTHQIIEERKKTGKVRNDFLQLLMDTAKEVAEDEKCDEKEDISANYENGDAGQHMSKNVTKKHLSMEELVAQCIIFFIAGYETAASTLAFATYMLALNPSVQEAAREEIDSVFKETNGELTYEALQKMKYLDNVISETLRLFPPGVRMERLAESDYILGNTGITVEKDTLISIPVCAMHKDPKFYPEPERFDPNRFTAEERAKRDIYTYLPFGFGPRNCIGMRFALLEMKVCLAEVIANFNIRRSPKTKVPLDFNIGLQGLLSPKEVIVDLNVRKESVN